MGLSSLLVSLQTPEHACKGGTQAKVHALHNFFEFPNDDKGNTGNELLCVALSK